MVSAVACDWTPTDSRRLARCWAALLLAAIFRRQKSNGDRPRDLRRRRFLRRVCWIDQPTKRRGGLGV